MMKRAHVNIDEKEALEIDFWKDSASEGPNVFTRSNFLNKTRECLQLDYKFNRYRKILDQKENVLEIGAGQGWASCYLKKFFLPGAEMTVTDISPYAIESLSYWENVFDVQILNSLACKSYELPFRDASFDLIFCYAAAHHFVKVRETLQECARVLVPGGHILFLYEPTCSSFLYPVHYHYVNSAPHGTPEDVLVPKKIRRYAEQAGLGYRHVYDPHQRIIRSVPVALYYRMLGAIPFIQRWFPSSSDLIFKKRKARKNKAAD